MYSIHSIFSSLWGEGRYLGRPVTFIKFATCNLNCVWCDANKTIRYRMQLEDVLNKVNLLDNNNIVITGGEPTIQPEMEILLVSLKRKNRWIALETNGLTNLEYLTLFDYIAVSPKSNYDSRYRKEKMIRKANEVRIVAETDHIQDFCKRMRSLITADDYYISPLEYNQKIHYGRAQKLLDKLNDDKPDKPNPPWALSVKLQKILGIR